LFEIGVGEIEGSFFVWELCAKKVLRKSACMREGRVVAFELKEGVEKGCILQFVDFMSGFEIDPLGKAKGCERCLGSEKRNEAMLRGENFEDFFLPKVGD